MADLGAIGRPISVIHVGTSGWSYPTWRGGFYPGDARPDTFLGYYAGRFDTVELNTTGYRLPAEDQFRRWADQTPAGFTFAPKLALYRLDRVSTFVERVALLGDRLGPIRVLVQNARDEGLLELLVGSVAPSVRLALDFRHPSWAGVELPAAVAVVDDLERASAFRYIRLREPPYSDEEIREVAARLRGGPETWAYFKHEDEPTAPAYAERLRELVR
jgi:uncharacterized protein YecE (DUF72 family)